MAASLTQQGNDGHRGLSLLTSEVIGMLSGLSLKEQGMNPTAARDDSMLLRVAAGRIKLTTRPPAILLRRPDRPCQRHTMVDTGGNARYIQRRFGLGSHHDRNLPAPGPRTERLVASSA